MNWSKVGATTANRLKDINWAMALMVAYMVIAAGALFILGIDFICDLLSRGAK